MQCDLEQSTQVACCVIFELLGQLKSLHMYLVNGEASKVFKRATTPGSNSTFPRHVHNGL